MREAPLERLLRFGHQACRGRRFVLSGEDDDVTLAAAELHKTVVEAEAAAGVCGWACRVTAEPAEGAYVVSHNGISSKDTDVQRVYAPATLKLDAEKLRLKLEAWLRDLHAGNRIDLNAV